MVDFLAAFGRHENLHDEKGNPRRLWTIWEYGAKQPGTVWCVVSSTGVTTRVNTVEKTKTRTIYSGRSTRSVSKEMMRNCYDKVGFMSTTRKVTLQQLQSEKDRKMTTATRNYYFRRTIAIWKEICALPAQLSAVSDRTCDKELELQQKPDKRLTNESTKQPTITDEPLTSPAHTFIARKSLFPDPKHCEFFHSTAAQIFYLPKNNSGGSAEKVSARSPPQTAMVMQATVPRNQPPQFDSVLTLASAPVEPPNYGKISSTGLPQVQSWVHHSLPTEIHAPRAYYRVHHRRRYNGS